MPPNPAKLPAIEDLLAVTDGVLQRVWSLPEPPGVELTEDAAQRYSHVWGLRVGDGSDSRDLILKWCPGGSQREYELADLSRRITADDDRFWKPELLERPTDHTLLIDRFDAGPLSASWAAPPLFGFGFWLRQACGELRLAGEWLSSFHAATREEAPYDVGGGLNRYLEARSTAMSELPDRIRRDLERRVDAVEAVATVRMYGDFSPHNVLHDRARLGFIDFAGVAEFDRMVPEYDLAQMLIGIEEKWTRSRRNLRRFSRGPLVRAQDALLEGYGCDSLDAGSLGLHLAIREFMVFASDLREPRFRRAKRAQRVAAIESYLDGTHPLTRGGVHAARGRRSART